MKDEQIQKRPEVLGDCKISKSTLYRLRALDDFPAPVRLTGSRAVGWRKSEVQAWIESRKKVEGR